MSKKTKQSLKTLGIVDGKEALTLDDARTKRRPSRTIEELIQFRGMPFKTLSEADYEMYLKNLDLARLQDECHSHGLLHNDSREIMRERLIKAFRNWVSARKVSEFVPQSPKDTGKVAREIAASITRKAIL